jgi:hypothetical protein
MNIKSLSDKELIIHAEELQLGNGISDYIDCYNEMLRRLKGK